MLKINLSSNFRYFNKLSPIYFETKRLLKRLRQIRTVSIRNSIKVSRYPALIVLGRQSIRMWQTTHASHVTVTPSTWRILDQVGVEQCDVARIAGPLTLSCCFGGAAWEASLILSILRLFLAPLLPQLHPRC